MTRLGPVLFWFLVVESMYVFTNILKGLLV